MRLTLLFRKYLANDCTPKELEELVMLLQQEHSSNTLDKEMRAVWDHLQAHTQLKQVNWEAMLQRIQQQPVILPAKQSSIRKMVLWTTGVAAAAALAFAGIRLLNKPAGVVPLGTPAYALVKADTGKQFVYLPDGSTVILNTGSSLRYAKAFGENAGSEREVVLEGEGYFDIKEDASHPFTVRSGELSTRVLGTAFNVKAYPDAQKISVTVTQGKVQVNGKNEETLGLLTANEQIVFDRTEEKFAKLAVNAVKEVAWKPSELFFDDKTLGELAAFLEAKYDCEVKIVSEEIAQKRISVTIGEKDPLEEILAIVGEVTGISYTINQKVITIK
ncbi:FecR family protein [uncultured Chitinophaga sp.]|uniref:FecR family protein n=1 Tax=uncultured Chitinophaga sp. TaxID=339340 RepID=UPI0025CBF736|nr:FecR domain-containing protein [uncultured Chitinophaga sp.]